MGEAFLVERTESDWLLGTLATDGYRGWVRGADVAAMPEPTHRVSVVRTLVLAAAELKKTTVCALSMGCAVRSIKQSAGYSEIILSGSRTGFVPSAHLVRLSHSIDDWVSVAETFIGMPYQWGGRGHLGLDCSALVQLSLQTSGITFPRDSCDQEMATGHALTMQDELIRGDLVFWPGHVGIMQNSTQLLHANAFHMQVVSEVLSDAVARIQSTEGPIRSIKRLPG